MCGVSAGSRKREKLKPIEARSCSRNVVWPEASSPPSRGSPPTCAFSAVSTDVGNQESGIWEHRGSELEHRLGLLGPRAGTSWCRTLPFLRCFSENKAKHKWVSCIQFAGPQRSKAQYTELRRKNASVSTGQLLGSRQRAQGMWDQVLRGERLRPGRQQWSALRRLGAFAALGPTVC